MDRPKPRRQRIAVAVLMAQLLVLTGKILPEIKAKPRATRNKTAAKTKTGKRRGRPRKERPKEQTHKGKDARSAEQQITNKATVSAGQS